jgi:hypothetical protein
MQIQTCFVVILPAFINAFLQVGKHMAGGGECQKNCRYEAAFLFRIAASTVPVSINPR